MFGLPLPLPGMDEQPDLGPNIQLPQGQKRGMFGGGNLQNALTAAAAGFLSRRNPQVSQSLLEQIAMKQRQQMADAQYQRERADKRDDFTFEQDYKSSHAGPDDFSQRVQALEALKPGLGMQYAQTYARNGGGLGIVTNPVTGQQFAPPQSPPAEAVARLKANPAEAAQFDEIFGPGASAGILGGPTQPASGGFPY